MIEVEKTKLDGVLLIKPKIFEDFRGFYVETYNIRDFKEKGIDVQFVEDDISTSFRHVLRGIHGDNKTWKLIQCMRGRIYVVIVNCDKSNVDTVTGRDYRSGGFGSWVSFTLTEKNRHQVLVPPNHGTSHLVLSDGAIFHYKQSTYYDPKNLKQFTYRYDDPRFNIWWPIKNPILSERDEKQKND